MNAHRVNIIGLLQLIASEQEQRNYQEEVPFVSVPTEMCCQWFDDFYHPESPGFNQAFSPEELESFKVFNSLFGKYVDSIPELLEELPNNPGWAEISTLAKEIVLRHGWRGLKLEYDTE